jgi:hypothetical protein
MVFCRLLKTFARLILKVLEHELHHEMLRYRKFVMYRTDLRFDQHVQDFCLS